MVMNGFVNFIVSQSGLVLLQQIAYFIINSATRKTTKKVVRPRLTWDLIVPVGFSVLFFRKKKLNVQYNHIKLYTIKTSTIHILYSINFLSIKKTLTVYVVQFLKTWFK